MMRIALIALLGALALGGCNDTLFIATPPAPSYAPIAAPSSMPQLAGQE